MKLRLTIITLTISSLFCFVATAEGLVNQQSVSILDKVSETYKNSSGTELDIKIFMNDEKTKSSNSTTGNLKTKGNKFILTSDFATLIFDGKTLYVHSKITEEITISEPAKEDISGVDPTAILGIYKQGFKVNAPQEKSEKDKKIYLIELYPENRSAEYFKIEIKIEADTYKPISIATYAKNGITNTILINKIQTNKEFTDKDFAFDARKFPKAQIIDIR